MMKRARPRHQVSGRQPGWRTFRIILLIICAGLALWGTVLGQEQPAEEKNKPAVGEIKVFLLGEHQVLGSYSAEEGGVRKENYFLLTKYPRKNSARLETGDQAQKPPFFKDLEKSPTLLEYQKAQGFPMERSAEGMYYAFLKYLQDPSKPDLVWQNRAVALKRQGVEQLGQAPTKPDSAASRVFYLERKGGKLNKEDSAPQLSPEEDKKIEADIAAKLKRFPTINPNAHLLVVVRDKTNVVRLGVIPSGAGEIPVGAAPTGSPGGEGAVEAAPSPQKGRPALLVLLGFLAAFVGMGSGAWFFNRNLSAPVTVANQASGLTATAPLPAEQFEAKFLEIRQRLDSLRASLPSERSLQAAVNRELTGMSQTLQQSLNSMAQKLDPNLGPALRTLNENLVGIAGELKQENTSILAQVQGLGQGVAELERDAQLALERLPDPKLHLSAAEQDVYRRAGQIGSLLLALSDDEVRPHLPPKALRAADHPGALLWRSLIEEFWRTFSTVRLAQFVTDLRWAGQGLKPEMDDSAVKSVSEVQQEVDVLTSSCLGPAKVLLFRLKLLADRTGTPLDQETQYRLLKMDEIIGNIDGLIAQPPFNLAPVRLTPFAKFSTFKDSCLNPTIVDYPTYFPTLLRPASEDLLLLDVREWAFQKQREQKEWLFGRRAEVVIG